MKPTPEQIAAGRKLWCPKRKEVDEQCASCPFREGNDKLFGKIIAKIWPFKKLVPSHDEIEHARNSVKQDLKDHHSGDFICHFTAYNPDGSLTDPKFHRQCKGATEWWKKGGI